MNDAQTHSYGQEYIPRDLPTENIPSDGVAFPFLEMGTSFVIGLAIGYVVKKSFKILLFVLGAGLIFLYFSGADITGQDLENKVSDGVSMFQSFTGKLKAWLSELELSSKAGAIAGFFTGIKFG
jgi:uncharacterized membrane protein (Fun14 family)